MRIDELRLIAFGPFTGTVLDLSGGQEGFHLVYGANEAGKSSALRALRYALYGIPERSADNFIHPYAKMRIGTVIRSADRQVFEFVRRKGRGSTLHATDNASSLDETDLQHYLGHVHADLFDTMFAIGHEDLVRGGRDIVKGGGDVGRLVFSAASGIVNLREIQNDLQEATNRLFRPSGQKQTINEALARLSRHRKDLRDAQLPGREWAGHDEALRAATADKTAVEARLAEQQKELNRLRRIQEALPSSPAARNSYTTLRTVRRPLFCRRIFLKNAASCSRPATSLSEKKNRPEKPSMPRNASFQNWTLRPVFWTTTI